MPLRNCTVSAPGKVILHGEHAVVYGKCAVASCLNLRAQLNLTVEPIDSSSYSSSSSSSISCLQLILLDLRPASLSSLPSSSSPTLSSPDQLLTLQWDHSDLALLQAKCTSETTLAPSEEFLIAIKNIATKVLGSLSPDFAKVAEVAHTAATLFLYLFSKLALPFYDFKSEVVKVSLKSDLPIGAGLGSSASYAVCIASGFLTASGQVEIKSKFERAELDMINQWAYEGERLMHGNPSGVDNAVSTFGGTIKMINRVMTPVEKSPEIRILLVNTKVPRSTKALVAKVKANLDLYPSILGGILETIEKISQESLMVLEQLADMKISADQRKALFSKLEDFVSINHDCLNSCGVGHPALTLVQMISSRHGCHAKLTGAGGGGCAFVLLREDVSENTISELKKEFAEHHFDSWVTTVGGPGVVAHI